MKDKKAWRLAQLIVSLALTFGGLGAILTIVGETLTTGKGLYLEFIIAALALVIGIAWMKRIPLYYLKENEKEEVEV